MTDFQIAVQIVATSIMAITSIVMAVVSWFLYINAHRMRLISEKNVDIAIWQQRWEVYKKISNWPLEAKKYVEFTKENVGIADWEMEIEKLGVIDIANHLDQGLLLFGQNIELVKIIKKYQDWLQPAISYSIFKAENMNRVNGTLEHLVDWYIKVYRIKHQQKFEEFLTL